jgi:hypothetical protein
LSVDRSAVPEPASVLIVRTAHPAFGSRAPPHTG